MQIQKHYLIIINNPHQQEILQTVALRSTVDVWQLTIDRIRNFAFIFQLLSSWYARGKSLWDGAVACLTLSLGTGDTHGCNNYCRFCQPRNLDVWHKAASLCPIETYHVHQNYPCDSGSGTALRLLDLLRWMLAVNSTVLSDDPGLKHFNAREWKRSTQRRLSMPMAVAHVSFGRCKKTTHSCNSEL